MPDSPLTLADLSGHRVVIVGTGREGTALGKYLRASPPQWVGALDGHEGDSATAWRHEFGDSIPLWTIDSETEGLPPEILSASVAVVSPGIAVTSRLHELLRESGLIITSGSALFVAEHADHLVGVTGSKGKSTTSTLTHHLLSHAGFASGLGGNMGIPLVGLETHPHYVVELSSYQCHYLTRSPRVCVLTALFPEHLDWHGSESAYYGSKLNLIANAPEIVIANSTDDILKGEVTRRFPDQRVVWVGDGEPWRVGEHEGRTWLLTPGGPVIPADELPLLGSHNHTNALMALVAAHYASGLEPSLLAEGFRSFRPLPHRLEPISDPSGVVFVNDSLATNPHAAAAALRALGSNVVLVIGGMDRGVDYQVLMDQIVTTRPKAVLGVPESGARLIALLTQTLSSHGGAPGMVVESTDSIEDAVRRSREIAQPGDYVLLSPAAPSFGRYRDYAERAEDFLFSIEKTRRDTP